MKNVSSLLISALLLTALPGCRKNSPTDKSEPPVVEPVPTKPAEVPPPEEKPSATVLTTEDLSPEERDKIRDEVWRTPLGRMFNNYIFEPANSEQTGDRAQGLVDRIFSDSTLRLTRLVAIELMISDLYRNKLVDAGLNERLSILNLALEFRRHSLDAAVTRSVFAQLPVFILLGAVGGSPEVRTQANALVQGAWRRFTSFFARPQDAQESARWFKQIAPRRLIGAPVLQDYSLYRAGSVFLHTFGAYAVLVYQGQSSSLDAASVQEKIWVYGLRNYVDFREL